MELIGREPQLRMLADAISDAKNGRARAVTVCGEAGSGKTMLLDAAAAEARDTVHTIRIAGHPAETDLPLAGVHQLVREARFDGVVTAAGQDPLRDASALLEALTTLARRRPVLLVIDDAQWLDGPSHRALVFVARRLDADAMCVVFGVRSPHDEHLTVGTRLDVGPLSRQESLALLHRTYPQMSARVAAKIAQQAVGLPLALCEIPAELDAAQQRGTEPLPADLPLGRSITGLFAKRLAALTDAARLCLLAASFDTLSPTAYVAVLRRLGCSLDDLDEAERLGLARLREGRCQFRHPLVSAAVRNEARSQHLVAVHRALVTQFADDPVRLASHLKQDPNVDPETLRTAVLQGARAARDARSYDDAAELWKSASQLASEPTQKRAFLREAVRCLALSGAGPEARTLIEQLLAETTEAIERAQVLRDLTWLSLWTQSVAPHDDERIEAHGIELIQAGDTRTREAGRDLLAALATAMLGAGEYRRAQQVCATLHEHVADRLTLEQRLLCDVIAVMAGEPGGGALLRGRWTDSYPWQHILDPATPAGFITVVPGWLGEYEIVDEVIAHCRRATDEYGPSASGFYIASSMTASQERRQGRWDRALLEFEALERMVIDTDFAAPYPFIALRHAHLLAARGDTSSCELLRQQAREQAPAWVPILAHLDHAVAGLLALSHRDFTTALQHLDLAGEIERQVGLVPSGYLSRFADTFEAAWRLGKAADRLGDLTAFEKAMDGVGHVAMLGLATRCRALAAAPQHMDALFADAVDKLSREPDGFETARTHLLWGERLRRARRKAEAHKKLSLAHETFVRLGAGSWAEQCNAELAACGIRRINDPALASGPAAQLTPREFEVAREVAGGATNAEAARRLFISERTVEFHLSSVFRKLDIDGREALRVIMEA